MPSPRCATHQQYELEGCGRHKCHYQWRVIAPEGTGALVLHAVTDRRDRRSRQPGDPGTKSVAVLHGPHGCASSTSCVNAVCGDFAAIVRGEMDEYMKAKLWNHNIHYHPSILAVAPEDCSCAARCWLRRRNATGELRSVSERVVGIDCDPHSIEVARAQGGEGIEYVLGDVPLEYSFEACFDLVASVATSTTWTRGWASVAWPARAPGDPGRGWPGMLGRVGDLRVRHRRRSRYACIQAHSSEGIIGSTMHPRLWPPPLSYAELRRIAARLLPGVEYRRHVLWRYSLVWTRPGADRLYDGRRLATTACTDGAACRSLRLSVGQ